MNDDSWIDLEIGQGFALFLGDLNQLFSFASNSDTENFDETNAASQTLDKFTDLDRRHSFSFVR